MAANLGAVFGTQISLILTPWDFYLLGCLNDKVYKMNPHTLEEPKNNIRLEISTIIGKNPRQLTTKYSKGTST
jgi:hypothetical protein